LTGPVFADSSALVKLYADEDGHEVVRALAPIAVSQIARVEVPAAIWRKQRVEGIDPVDARTLVEDFEADYFGTTSEPARFATVVVDASVLDAAAHLCGTHGLRAYDAVQLSCALAARAADPGCRTLAAYDDALRAAAAREGFTLVPYV